MMGSRDWFAPRGIVWQVCWQVAAGGVDGGLDIAPAASLPVQDRTAKQSSRAEMLDRSFAEAGNMAELTFKQVATMMPWSRGSLRAESLT
jgi:hypothetical protein